MNRSSPVIRPLAVGGDLHGAFPIVLAVLFTLLPAPAAAAEQDAVRAIQVNLAEEPFRFSVIDTQRGVTLLESDGPVVVESVRGHAPYRKKPYLRWTPGKVVKLASADRVITRSEQGGWTRCELGNGGGLVLDVLQVPAQRHVGIEPR